MKAKNNTLILELLVMGFVLMILQGCKKNNLVPATTDYSQSILYFMAWRELR